MVAEDVTHLFTKGYFKELIRSDKEIPVYKKSAIIDTNYLIQINRQDLISLFFDKDYEEKIPNPLKRQMASLFRSQTRGEIVLFFSDAILREFIYVSPDKMDLIPQYTRYLRKIGSKRQYESYFLDLASLLNLRAREKKHSVGLLDTYSYVVSNLVGIDYFVTENGDLKGIFGYINEIRTAAHLDKVAEIDKLKKLNKLLFNIAEEVFPLKKVLEYLFLSRERLTLPLDIKKMTDDLAKVSEKTESVAIICEMLNEIEEQKDMLDPGHKPLLAEARELVKGICKSVDLEIPEHLGKIDVGTVSVNLIEKDGLWEKPSDLDKIYSALFDVIDDINRKMYPEEEEGYRNLEEFFDDTLSELQVKAKCDCSHEFETYLAYGGVVASEPREMGAELMHVWNNEFDCPKCNEFRQIEVLLWEYPVGWLNYVDFDSDCEILNKDEIYHKIGLIPNSE